MVTREQRLRERETKRILHEEQLRRLRDDEGTPESSSGLGARTSERNRKVELERTQKALEQLQDDEEEWYFDCSVCGVHGKNLVSEKSSPIVVKALILVRTMARTAWPAKIVTSGNTARAMALAKQKQNRTNFTSYATAARSLRHRSKYD